MLNSDFERQIRDENKRFGRVEVSETPHHNVDCQVIGALSSDIDRLEIEYKGLLADSRLVAIFEDSQNQVKSALDQSLAEQKHLLGQITSEASLSCRAIYEQNDDWSQSFQRKQGEVRDQFQSLRSRADEAFLSENKTFSEQKEQMRILSTQKLQQIETLSKQLAETNDRNREDLRQREAQYETALRALEVTRQARVDVSDLDRRIAVQTRQRDLARQKCETGGQRQEERSEIERLENLLAGMVEQTSQRHPELKVKRQPLPVRPVWEVSRLTRLPSLKPRGN
jgi:hypothetical protein